jgi:predicted phosphodiesterase
MRYAVISDIHANRQALKAVLKDINMLGADKIVCLGDIVGYGPSPVEVIDILRTNVDHFLLGNHDAVVAGYINADNFNISAAKVIEWTRTQLDSDCVEFLQNIPLLLLGNNIKFTHGEFENPGRFGYIDDEASALSTFNSCSESLMMAGHSHVPGIFVIGNSGVPHWLKPQNFGFEENKRYIVNVGSVGQPRDNDNRASYCIIDDEVNDVLFRKVNFDISAYKRDLAKNKLPAVSGFLFLDKDIPKTERAPASAKSEETADFTPLSKADTVKIKKEVENLQQTVTQLQRSKKKLLFLVLLLTAALISISVFFISNTNQPSGLYIIPPSNYHLPAETLKKIQTRRELLSMPEKRGVISKDIPLKQWSIALTDPSEQKIEITEVIDSKKKKIPAFYIKSDIAKPLLISSFPLPAKKGMRFSASASFKALDLQSGIVEIALKQQFPDGTEKTLRTREPKKLAESAKWKSTSVTILSKEPLLRDGKIILEIRSAIKGALLIRKCSLKRK